MEILIPLDPTQMADIFEEIVATEGKASVGKVAKYLAQHGILSPRTHRPFSRQNVWLSLIKSPRGRKLMGQ